MSSMIIQRVRKNADEGRGVPFATLIGFKDDNGVVTVSWSKCHKNDHFDGRVGVDMARMRMKHPSLRRPVPFKIRHDLQAFKDRCSRYFKVDIEDINVV